MDVEPHNKSVDIWHRDFCPWMRNRKLKIAISYTFYSLVLANVLFLDYLAVFHWNWIRVSQETGVSPSIVFTLLVVSIVTPILAMWIAVYLPRHIGYRGTHNIMMASWIGTTHLALELNKTKSPTWTQSDYIFAWRLITGLGLVLCIAFLAMSFIVLRLIRKGKSLNAWIPNLKHDGTSWSKPATPRLLPVDAEAKTRLDSWIFGTIFPFIGSHYRSLLCV